MIEICQPEASATTHSRKPSLPKFKVLETKAISVVGLVDATLRGMSMGIYCRRHLIYHHWSGMYQSFKLDTLDHQFLFHRHEM